MSSDQSDEDQANSLVLELLTQSAGRPDPYPLYHRLREVAPVHRSPFGLWFATRYDDCQVVLRDRRLGRGDHELRVKRDPRLPGTPLFEWEKQVMVFADPPEHTRLRGLVAKAFTPKMVQRQRERITAFVDAALDRAADAGGMDVIADLSHPLPFWLISEMLGLPEADREDYRRWTEARAGILQPLFSDEALAVANSAFVESEAYLRSLVAERRGRPGDDLLSALIAAEEEGGRLTEGELIANVNMIVSAGFETVMHGIANGVLTLLRHPDQLAELRAHPDLISNAVEEILRYDNPVPLAPPRTAFVDVELGEVVIPCGETVLPVIAAGNRDPGRFDQPDTFDIRRPDCHPVSFGGGPHICLGASLARLQLVLAIGRLVRRFPFLELVEAGPTWTTTFNRRGPVALPIRCGGA